MQMTEVFCTYDVLVGTIIEQLRKRRNLLQTGVAAETKVSVSTYSRYETGEVPMSVTNLYLTLTHLDVQMEDFFQITSGVECFLFDKGIEVEVEKEELSGIQLRGKALKDLIKDKVIQLDNEHTAIAFGG